MSLTQTVAPTVEPVTLAEFKSVIDYPDVDRDAELADWLAASRVLVEEYLWSQLVNATWAWKLPSFASQLVVPRGPLVSVSSIQYIDADGNQQTLGSGVYQVLTGFPGRIEQAYGETWPTTREQSEAVTVTFVAGYGAAAANVPSPIRRAILVLAAEMFNSCEMSGMPEAVKLMLSPYRSRHVRSAECVA